MRVDWQEKQDYYLQHLLQFKQNISQNLQFKQKLPQIISQIINQNNCAVNPEALQTQNNQQANSDTIYHKKLSQSDIQIPNQLQQVPSIVSILWQVFTKTLQKINQNSIHMVDFLGEIIKQYALLNIQYHEEVSRNQILLKQIEEKSQSEQILQTANNSIYRQKQALIKQISMYQSIQDAINEKDNQLYDSQLRNKELQEIIHNQQQQLEEATKNIMDLNCKIKSIQNKKIIVQIDKQQTQTECHLLTLKNQDLLSQIKQLLCSNKQLQVQNQQLLQQIKHISNSAESQSSHYNKSSSTKNISKCHASSKSQHIYLDQEYINTDIQPCQNSNSLQKYSRNQDSQGILFRVKSLQSIQSEVQLFNLRQELQKNNAFNCQNKIQTQKLTISIGIMTEPETFQGLQKPNEQNYYDIPLLHLNKLENPHKKKQFIGQVNDLSESVYIQNFDIPKNNETIQTKNRIKTQRSQIYEPITSRSFVHELVHRRVSKSRIVESIAQAEVKKNNSSLIGKINSSMTDKFVTKRIKRNNHTKTETQTSIQPQSSVLNSFRKIFVEKRIKK